MSGDVGRGISYCARRLPNPVISDGHADAALANSRENGPFPAAAQSPPRRFRETTELAPESEGHDPVIIEFAQASALPTTADLDDGHGGSYAFRSLPIYTQKIPSKNRV
jgi:hypothetical protein